MNEGGGAEANSAFAFCNSACRSAMFAAEKRGRELEGIREQGKKREGKRGS